jgi:peptidoglycan/xylan/chitin deacetylase (PgdA/CDA1 family)
MSAYYRITTSPHRFRDHMQWIREHGYEVIGLERALDLVATRAIRDRRQVVVTFDDGFADFLTAAWPVLQQFSCTATVFLPTAFVGHTFNERACLTWDDVRALHGDGVTFGAHTMTHPTLHGLPWRRVRSELRGSRAKIEDELGAPIKTFAYPYAFPQEDGAFVARIRHELTEAGYRAAVTTVIGRMRLHSDPLCIRRLAVNEADDKSLFIAKLEGAYDWVARVQSVSRRVRRTGRRQSGEVCA